MNIRRFINSPAFLLCLGFAVVMGACNDDAGKEEEMNFDQQALLSNLGQNVIFPNYADFKAKTNALKTAVTAFTTQPTTESLATAREAQKEAYLAWQYINLYEFGPAADLALRMNVNSFPARYTTIEDNIASGSWDLKSFTSVDQKGLPALDYLLFAGTDINETLEAYISDEHAENRLQYLQDVSTDLNAFSEEVYKGWHPEEGNYLGTFSTKTGNSAGSSLSLLVNQFNQGYELIKNKKLGLPLGKKSLEGETFPLAVEAYYSGFSLELMQANLLSVENTFTGKANGADGVGLDDYLDAIYQAGIIQEDLSAEIMQQLTKIKNAVDAISNPLSQALENNTTAANQAYEEIQQLVVLIKNDMPSALGVLITYFDNDGD